MNPQYVPNSVLAAGDRMVNETKLLALGECILAGFAHSAKNRFWWCEIANIFYFGRTLTTCNIDFPLISVLLSRMIHSQIPRYINV